MKRGGKLGAVGLGLLAIGLAVLGVAAFLAIFVVQETRIGRGLAERGASTEALVVSAERIERSQCARSQRAVCWAADNYIAIVVYHVSGLRSGSELRLTAEEFQAFETGTEVFVDLVYLPSDPAHVERTQGDRLAAAGRDTLHIYILMAFGLTFTAIGSIALLVARKQAPRLSTGQGR